MAQENEIYQTTVIKTKKCSSCKLEKELTAYTKYKNGKDGVHNQCKVCRTIAFDKYRKTDKYKALLKRFNDNPKTKKRKRDWATSKNGRNQHLSYLYDLTLIQYDELLRIQQNVCAICKKLETKKHKSGTLRSLAVDHCHKTGKVRGLLCSRCNICIGQMEDNSDLLIAAASYVASGGVR